MKWEAHDRVGSFDGDGSGVQGGVRALHYFCGGSRPSPHCSSLELWIRSSARRRSVPR
jgi:hypothetical protein